MPDPRLDNAQPAAPQSASGKPRIVVADDDADMREHLVRLFGKAYQVDTFPDGQAALEAIRVQLPDLILTDVMMPRLDGIGLLRELRADVRTRPVPVILFSSNAGDELKAEGMQLGADEYIAKPFRTRELLNRVQAQLELVRLRRGSSAELSQRKEAEEKLAAQRRLYGAILSSTIDLAYVFDRNHRFTYANDALLAMWGKTWEEAIGKNCLELGYPPWHAEMHGREIEEVIATKKPVRGEVPFTGTHGTRIYDYIFVPVVGKNGEVEAVAGTTRDVTDHRQAAEQLEKTVAERTASLREAVEQMEEFSYSVSHDLRAPLRAIIAYAGILTEEYGHCLDDAGREYLAKIRRSGERMNRLTQDVLTYSRVARAQVHLEPVSLERVIRDVIQQYPNLQAIADEIEIVTPLPSVLGHEITLGQSVANLLTNAVKFVPTEVKPHVKIWSELRGENVRVWFQDNGIGIKPEHQGRIFQMFERVHPEGHYEGTGIGLTIVRKAIEKMGGTVGMESDGTHGSRFWIELRGVDAVK